jgi:pimeloyl-ACP methyl ester carboxylesterase
MSLDPHRPCQPRPLVFLKSLLGLTALVLGFSVCLSSTPAWAQDKAEDKTEKKAERRADDAEIPAPEDIELKTKEDGLLIKAAYFPGTKGQDSIPVILLHGFKGSRKDFTQGGGLAAYLQEKLGCAVIVPDLRGHGESTKFAAADPADDKLNGNEAEEKEKKKAADLRKKKLEANLPAQISAMVTDDLRAVKDFLWKKNNEKALNIDKLVVIGVDMGAGLALRYVAFDAVGYEQEEAFHGPLKLGKFVKAAVLISPVTSIASLKPPHASRADADLAAKVIAGLQIPRVMTKPDVQKLPVLIAVGNKSTEYFKDAEKLSNQFKMMRPSEEKLKVKARTLIFLSKIETPLQGAKLLNEPSLEVPGKIVSFLTFRLIDNPDAKEWVWKKRTLPHE